MTEVKCRYCENKGTKNEMKLHIKVSATGRRYKEYFHEECFALKESRDKAVKLFYEYTQSLEPIKMINTAFKQMRDQGINEHQILYIMEYIVKNKCVLNYAMGIKYYATPAIKEYKSRQQFLKKQNINQEKTSSIGIIVEECKVKKQVKVEDDLDISSFL
ncbi:hypothetical protein ACR77J_07340 [Tissierella praeacuta]|uniref:hypothetical protein n=1 Tax=Tissierella praeacuta TaxID=43131 RepID=UPI003DA3288E